MSFKELYDCEVLITEIEISKKLVWISLQVFEEGVELSFE
jgi:hypothetical protein